MRRLRAVALLLLVAWRPGAAQTPVATAAPVRRVVSLAPSVTETLFALGAGSVVVGVSTYCDYPDAVKRLPRVGDFLMPNVERIIALRPDLVIAVPSPGNEEPVRALQRLGLRVLVVDPQSVQQTREAIVSIAAAIGRAAAGRRLAAALDAGLQAVQQRLRNAPPRRVLMVVGEKPLIAAGSGTFQDELIRMAHGQNVAAQTGAAWPHIGLESVIAWAPEVIIDATMGSETHAADAPFWRQFPSLPAVRDGRIYGFRSEVLLRPGPRLAEALSTIAHFVHPECFTANGAPAPARRS